MIGIIALMALLYTVINQSFGLAAVVNTVDPETLAVNGVALADQPQAQLVETLRQCLQRPYASL
ncbi:MAG: hypothetical protein R2873_17365 [Caldilineaceae bacterium]